MSNKMTCYICCKDIRHKQRTMHLLGGVAQWVCQGECYKQIHELWKKEKQNDYGKGRYRG